MTSTHTAIAEAAKNPKGYKTRFCGTYLNGAQSPGEARALRYLEYAKERLVSWLKDYSEITITFFGTLAQIDYRHARILACRIHNNWVFMEPAEGGYNYVVPNNPHHYILSTLGKLLAEPVNHKEIV